MTTEKLWTRANGTQVAVGEMNDYHLMNARRSVHQRHISRAAIDYEDQIEDQLYWLGTFDAEISRRGLDKPKGEQP